jgi:hypothetical protein
LELLSQIEKITGEKKRESIEKVWKECGGDFTKTLDRIFELQQHQEDQQVDANDKPENELPPVGEDSQVMENNVTEEVKESDSSISQKALAKQARKAAAEERKRKKEAKKNKLKGGSRVVSVISEKILDDQDPISLLGDSFNGIRI